MVGPIVNTALRATYLSSPQRLNEVPSEALPEAKKEPSRSLLTAIADSTDQIAEHWRSYGSLEIAKPLLKRFGALASAFPDVVRTVRTLGGNDPGGGEGIRHIVRATTQTAATGVAAGLLFKGATLAAGALGATAAAPAIGVGVAIGGLYVAAPYIGRAANAAAETGYQVGHRAAHLASTSVVRAGQWIGSFF